MNGECYLSYLYSNHAWLARLHLREPEGYVGPRQFFVNHALPISAAGTSFQIALLVVNGDLWKYKSAVSIMKRLERASADLDHLVYYVMLDQHS